jgi:hypothetical protein
MKENENENGLPAREGCAGGAYALRASGKICLRHLIVNTFLPPPRGAMPALARLAGGGPRNPL